MQETQSTSECFEASRAQRVIISFVAVALLAVCLTGLQTAHHLLERTMSGHGGLDRSGRLQEIFIFVACIETLIAFCVFCCLTIVWAAIQPAWGSRAFNLVGRQVWQQLLLFMVGFVIIIGVYAMLINGGG